MLCSICATFRALEHSTHCQVPTALHFTALHFTALHFTALHCSEVPIDTSLEDDCPDKIRKFILLLIIPVNCFGEPRAHCPLRIIAGKKFSRVWIWCVNRRV